VIDAVLIPRASSAASDREEKWSPAVGEATDPSAPALAKMV
jgi:hypothetical protein